MAEEYFEKTPRKANRWFRVAIVFALLYGVTFSLASFLNWIFFFATAYAFFMSYFRLPVQPKIFQGKRRSSQTWTGPTQFGAGGPAAQPPAVDRIKRIVFTIAGGVFALFVFFFIIGIMNPEPASDTAPEYEDLSADGTPPTASELVQRGNDFFNDAKYDSADKYYDRALVMDGGNMEALYGKGIVMYQAGNKEGAMALFRRAYEGGFRFAWLSWVLADMHDKNGNSSEAITLYKESVKLDSGYTDSYKRLAELEPAYRDKYLELAEKHASN